MQDAGQWHDGVQAMSPPSGRGGAGVELGAYVRTALRGIWWMVAGLVAGLLLAIAFLGLRPPVYTATAAVNVNVITVEPFGSARSASGLLDPQTEASIATSYRVAQAAAARLADGTTPEELGASVTARPIADATILRISSSASTADAARRHADVLAEEYLRYREEQAVQRKEAILGSIENSLTELNEELARATTPDQRAAIQTEIDGLRSRRNDLVNLDTTGGSVIDPAMANAVEVEPSRLLVLASGAVAGTALGLMAAFVVQALRRKVHHADDVVGALGPTWVVGDEGRRARATSPEDLRLVRDRAMLATEGTTPRLVSVVDQTRAEYPSGVSLVLAHVLTQRLPAAQVVVLGLDAERRAAVIEALELTGDPGAAMTSPVVPGVDVRLPLSSTGADEPDPVLTTEATALLAGASGPSVVVLPASSTEASRVAAGLRSDIITVVVQQGSTRRKDLTALREDLAAVGSPVAAVLLVGGASGPDPAATGEAAPKHADWAEEEDAVVTAADEPDRVARGRADQSSR